jgi:hypothetical protein
MFVLSCHAPWRHITERWVILYEILVDEIFQLWRADVSGSGREGRGGRTARR